MRFHDLLDGRMFTGGSTDLADLVLSWTRQHRTRITVGVNAHVVKLAGSDAVFAAQIRRTDLLHADGQSVVWGAKALGVKITERVATTDLAPLVLERAAAAGLCVYFLGGEAGVAAEAARRVMARFPGVTVHSHHGYLDSGETEEVLAELASCRPAILFVGMGDPIQLDWVLEHRDRLAGAVAITCGGLFDWLSERNRRSPAWMIRLGLEWLYRLAIEPRRLWRRYLIGNPRFILGVVRSALVVRHRRGAPPRRSDRVVGTATAELGIVDLNAMFRARRAPQRRTREY